MKSYFRKNSGDTGAVKSAPVLFCKALASLAKCTLLAASVALVPFADAGKDEDRPNIVIILGDDIGFADAQVYGGEISTPNIDSLAKEGMMMTNYRTSSSCSPTRTMLMTGVDNHRAGLGQMLELLTPNQEGKPGYEGILNDKVVTIASLLKDAGYHTYMTGKWHLGGAEEGHGKPPFERGFEETYALLEGAADCYTDRGLSPVAPVAHYSRNGKPIKLPKDYYATRNLTDEMIGFIDKNRKDDKPFFGYLSFTAAHVPLQAPKEYIDKYVDAGTYDAGWDVIRSERFERMKKLGIIPDYLKMPDRWPTERPWYSLNKEEKRFAAKTMAVYAAMVDYMDMSIGRFIDYLKEIGEYENTIIVYFTDNGPDGHNRAASADYQKWFKEIDVDTSYENMGLINSFVTRPLEWSQVSNTPHWGEKATQGEGGVIAQCIVSYPGVIEGGTRSDAFLSVLNITPTLLDFAGVTHPGTDYKGREIFPLDGRSARPLLEGWQDRIYGPDEPIPFEVFGTVNKAIYMGDWKALRMGIEPFATEDVLWKLFNMKMDPTEQVDLAGFYPKQLEKMVAAYEEYELEVGYAPAKVEEPEVTKTESGCTITVFEKGDYKLHCFTAPGTGAFNCTHIIESDNVLVLVDTQFLVPFAKEFRAYADSLGKPIDRIYISHEHPDHFFGLAVAFRDVDSYALAGTRDFIRDVGPGMLKNKQAKMGSKVPESIAVPTKEVLPGREVIDGIEYEFVRLVGGEAPVQLVIKVRELGALIAQDVVYSDIHLYLGENDVSNWIEHLETLQGYGGYDLVLPGHGLPADKTVLADNIAYLRVAAQVLPTVKSPQDLKRRLTQAFPDRQGAFFIDVYGPLLFNQ